MYRKYMSGRREGREGETERDRETEKQRDSEQDRQTDRVKFLMIRCARFSVCGLIECLVREPTARILFFFWRIASDEILSFFIGLSQCV